MKTYINRVQRATQDNDHTGAIKIVAQYVAKKHSTLQGVEKLQKYCDAIETLHNFYGHMPAHLDQSRNDIRKAVFSFLNEDERKRFEGVM